MSIVKHQVGHHFFSGAQESSSAKLGMWLFLVTEVLLFSGLFVAYTVIKSTKSTKDIKEVLRQKQLPTLREIVSELERQGLGCSTRTAMKDLAALGIENPRGREARREREARESLPFG